MGYTQGRELKTLAKQSYAGKIIPSTKAKIVYWMDYKPKEPILMIEGTPGSWYLETLLEGRIDLDDETQILSIDYGADWQCLNIVELIKEAVKITGYKKK